MVLVSFLLIFCAFFGAYLRWGKLPAAFFPLFFSSSIVSLLYISGLLQILQYMAPTIVAGALILLIMLRKKALICLARTPGLCLYLAGLVFLWFYLKDAVYLYLDEFSHWGLATKELFRTHALPQANSNLLFIEYPPGNALFHYLFLRIQGEFQEGISYWAHAALLLSPLPVLLHRLKWREFHIVIPIIGITLFIIFAFGLGVDNLMADHVLSTFFAVSAVVSFGILRTPKRKLYLIPSIITLSLTKQTGKFFAFSLCAIITVDLLLTAWQQGKKSNNQCITQSRRLQSFLLIVVLLFGISFVTVFSWNRYIGSIDIPRLVDEEQISTKNLWKILSGNISKEQSQVVLGFQESLINHGFNRLSPQPLFERIGLVTPRDAAKKIGKITQLHLMVCYLIAGLLLFMSSKRLQQRELFLAYMLVFIGLFAAYMTLVLIVEIFVFADLAPYQRHANVFNAGILIFLTGCFNSKLYKLKRRKLWTGGVGCLFLLLVFFYTPPVHFLHRNKKLVRQFKKYTQISQYAEHIRRNISPEATVYLIFQTSLGYEYHALNYKLSPIRTNRWRGGTENEKWEWSIRSHGQAPDTYFLPVKEWSDKLRQSFDYVFLGSPNQQFTQQYSTLFKDPDLPGKWPFYKVDKHSYPLVSLIPHGMDQP